MKKLITLCLALAVTASQAGDLTGKRIYVNPGHGGYNTSNDRNVVTIPFAAGDTLGFFESSCNLTKGLELRRLLLQANATVMISRTQNRDQDDKALSEIAEEANAFGADAFVSLHSNGLGTNNGTNYLEDVTSGAEIEEAVFNGGHFFSFKTGPTYQAATSVPQGLGIPLSGVARGKSVIDRNNVLHVNDANLRLVRTVSKIRFVFSSLEGLDPIFIENITLNKNMLYRKERFFLDGDHPNYWVEEPFDPSVQVRLVKGDNNIPVVQNADPTVYVHNSKYSDEEYETLVNNGVEDRMLTEYGPVYLPESDKRLSGTISFRIGYYSNITLEAPFSMATGNFHRNQTWLVYAYYIGSSKLVVSAVNVVPWEIVDDLPDHQVPNW